jgi:hypothetical protein
VGGEPQGFVSGLAQTLGVVIQPALECTGLRRCHERLSGW